jgi:1,4-dihydroxy-6-naphthoate synthase
MKLKIGFSPCPNDTFIFDALVNQKIDTEGLDIEFHLADVEELNQLAFRQTLDITKLSYHAFLYLHKDYILLNSGSALGYGVGPLLVALPGFPVNELNNKCIAVPGLYTTANLLMSLAFPEAINRKEMVFSEIESAVVNKTVDAGVIIHENRFTFQDKGLHQFADLGALWELQTGAPIPLGGIAALRSIPSTIATKFDRVLKRSIEYAFSNQQLSEFVKCNAQEMSEEVMRKHIQLYVNESTVNLGVKGREAIRVLFDLAVSKGLVQKSETELFLPEEA